MNPADRFVDHDGIYLLSHSIGLPVRGTREAAATYFDAWEHDTTAAWPRWLESIDAFRTSLAGLLGTTAAAICPQSTVSSALSKIFGSLRSTSERPTILLTEDTFPSLGFVCERSGFEVRFIDRGQDATDPTVWRDHIAADIDVVLVTHVQSNTGQLLPVAEVVDLARSHGAVTIVDVAQSVGVIPIDVTEWGADFVIGSCVKWLSGGPGAGWMWVDPEQVDRYEPIDVGWFSHAEPFEFDIHRFRYADDALRFWGGSPTVVPFTIARHSIDTIAAIGVETIRDHNLTLTDQIIEALGDRVVSPHDRARRSGTCIVDADEATADALLADGIEIDHRATGVRVSPHVHVSAADVDTFLRSVARRL
ncbi:aminotransferase class V-fold PLP-dependent enzyme [Ilumatobacter nonamiensis]|uniref:aminotransferase class V-fold PLP-dependent enzyme n=1 Tax=Ilumatobacter nonamiensis TaxID=467093 RepID=UPI000346E38C|nr:aminotransferase class V-fold PLP-dependent enzyme [Ilumatobacter nonamiensis]